MKCDVQQKRGFNRQAPLFGWLSSFRDATRNQTGCWLAWRSYHPWARDLQRRGHPGAIQQLTVSIAALRNYSCDFLFVSIGRVVILLIVGYPCGPSTMCVNREIRCNMQKNFKGNYNWLSRSEYIRSGILTYGRFLLRVASLEIKRPGLKGLLRPS